MRILYLTSVLMLCFSARASIDFGGEVFRWRETNSTPQTTVTINSNSVPTNRLAVMFLGWEVSSGTLLSNVYDSRGYSWTIGVTNLINTVHQSAIAWCWATNGFQSGDTITIGYSAGNNAQRAGTLVYLTGASQTQSGQFLKTNRFNSTVNTPYSTTNDNTLVVAMVQREQPSIYSGFDGTRIGGSSQLFGDSGSTIGLQNDMLYKAMPTAGSYDPVGEFTVDGVATNESYVVNWIAFDASKTYFVDFAGGSDVANGLTTSTPWKHHPLDPNATGTSDGTTLVAGDSVIFKGGVEYVGGITNAISGLQNYPVYFDGNSAGTFGTGKAKVNLETNFYRFLSLSGSNLTIRNFDIFAAKNTMPDTTAVVERGGVIVSNINYGGDNASFGAIHVNGGSFVSITDCRIHDFAWWSDLAITNAEVHVLTDSNVIATEPPLAQAGISIASGSHDITVSNAVIWATGRDAIRLTSTGIYNVSVLGCDIGGDATVTNKGWFTVAFRLAGGLSNIWIVANQIHDGWQYQGDADYQRSHSGDWLHIFGDNDHTLEADKDPHSIYLVGNRLYNDHSFSFSFGTGYSLIEDDFYDIFWINNLLINDFAGGVNTQWGSNIVFYANTFVTFDHGTGGDTAIRLSGDGAGFSTTNVVLRNNAFVSYSDNSGGAAPPISTSGSYDGAFPDSDYNLFYATGQSDRVAYWAGSGKTLSAWQSFSGQDAHSVYGNPLFTSLPTADVSSSGNFTPSATSPALNAGIYLAAWPVDYAVATRSNPPEIGALEGASGGGRALSVFTKGFIGGRVIIR